MIDINYLEGEFLKSVPAHDTTGKGLANLILESLKQFGVELKFLRGQGFNGATSMSGIYNGVQSHIRQIYPSAMYVHRSAHILNLVISKSCGVRLIMNCLSLIGEIQDFFIHLKRKNVLSHKILDSSNDTTKKTLKRSCVTRWIERYHAVHDFLELFEFIVESFSEISEWNDNDTSGKAQRLQKSILDRKFIISLLILSKGLGFGLPLSKHLQKVEIDLKLATRLADKTLEEMKCFRNNAENSFKKIYIAAHDLAAQFQVEITMPRVIGRQVNRMKAKLKYLSKIYRRVLPYIHIHT
ncbi:hypothetical protein QTP88_007315 [Uroleucon formosanum]